MVHVQMQNSNLTFIHVGFLHCFKRIEDYETSLFASILLAYRIGLERSVIL